MGSLKNQPGLDMPDRLSARYGGVPVIYVESEEDSYVFGECWFKDRLSHVEFKPASGQCGGFSGCNAVLQAVVDERRAGNVAWGIVDRDTVMGHELWQLVHETDDAAYEGAKPFGAEVKTLCRWEMENYLAEGEALERYCAEREFQTPRTMQIVYQELLDHCQALVPHAAANALMHIHRLQGLSDGHYKNHTRYPSRQAVDDDVRNTQLSRFPQVKETEYEQQVVAVDGFDAPNASPPERVKALLRRIHGKALLNRFASLHGIRDDMRGHLANRIKEMGLVPDEISAFVDAVASD